jgi:hypothetical protein
MYQKQRNLLKGMSYFLSCILNIIYDIHKFEYILHFFYMQIFNI